MSLVGSSARTFSAICAALNWPQPSLNGTHRHRLTQFRSSSTVPSSSRSYCLRPASPALPNRREGASLRWMPRNGSTWVYSGSKLSKPDTMSCHTSIPSRSQW